LGDIVLGGHIRFYLIRINIAYRGLKIKVVSWDRVDYAIEKSLLRKGLEILRNKKNARYPLSYCSTADPLERQNRKAVPSLLCA